MKIKIVKIMHGYTGKSIIGFSGWRMNVVSQKLFRFLKFEKLAKDYVFYTTYNLRYPVGFDFLIYMAQRYFNLDEVYEAYSLCFIAIHFSHENEQPL